MEQYRVLGMMSGTSLDGVDMAWCHFTHQAGNWKFTILEAVTIPYPEEWKIRLRNAYDSEGAMLSLLHADYGHYLGILARNFIHSRKIRPDFIASHGHTVFHRPDMGMTCQIGDGAALAAESGAPVVCDFRTTDVAKGGQGAPLVPVGDQWLFSSYPYCLNLGGFANISYVLGNKRIAGDICPVNFVLNYLASKLGYPFDPEGRLAKQGMVIGDFLTKLNGLEYYNRMFPKSLGREWVEQNVFPLLANQPEETPDLLATFSEHIALQIGRILNRKPAGNVLVTGGGAFNADLIQRIRSYTESTVVVPDNTIVHYKEALIFAFLGVLRMRNEVNCLRSVTGAREDSCSGTIYLP